MLFSDRLRVDAAQTAKVIQPNESKNLLTKTQHFALVDAVNFGSRNACNVHDGGKRDGEKTAADAEKQSLDTREGERSAKLNRGAPAFLRRNVNSALETVEYGANDIHERFSKGVKNALIEIRVLAGKFESHILAALLGNVADDAGKTPEELFDRHHAYFQDALVKLVEDASLKRHGVSKFRPQGIAGMLLVEFGKRAIEHGLSDDQFAHKIHNRIDAGCVHTKGAFSNRSGGGTRVSSLRCGAGFRCLCGANN